MTEDRSTPTSGAADGPHSDPVPSRSAIPLRVGIGVAFVLVVLDQLTKSYVEQVLTPGRFVPWLGPRIGWQLVYNPGAAFGLPVPWWVFPIVTVIVVVVVLRALPHTPSVLQALAYGMLLAGAIGNVLDRFLRDGATDGPRVGGGYVVDFVAWGGFPRFNVADSAITVGFVLLLLALWREERGIDREPPPAPSHDPEDR